MKYHMLAFFLGFLLDMLLGDPYCLPHPVRLIGRLIAGLEKRLLGPERQRDGEGEKQEEEGQRGEGQREEGQRGESQEGEKQRDRKQELRRGIVLAVLVPLLTVSAAALLLGAAYFLHPYAGLLAEAVMTYQILAAKCLKVESMKVYKSLKEEGLEDARRAVSMIVGRDTAALDEEGVAKAAIETVAENTSDGVIAPMLYTALGGPVLGFFYKAVNTMDSMVGYKNDRYLYFGRAAARLDDFVNFIPARISAVLMTGAAFLGGRCFSGKRAWQIYKRDRYNHASPNSAQTEAVCAGALGIRLAGDASYFGKVVKKPYIGDSLRRVEDEDIKRANRLMYLTAWLGEMLCLLLMAVCLLGGGAG